MLNSEFILVEPGDSQELHSAFTLVNSADGQQLYHAIECGDESEVARIVKDHYPPFETISQNKNKKENILLLAKNNLTILNILLNVYAEKIDPRSIAEAILIAEEGGNEAVVALLSKCVANIREAMEISASEGQKLYQAIKCANENEVLHIARDRYPLFETICQEKNKKVNLLLLANNNLKIIEVLLNVYGDHIAPLSKFDALWKAVGAKKYKVVTLLLTKCSADIGKTHKAFAINLAVKIGNLRTLNALLSDPSVAEMASFNDNSALKYAQSCIVKDPKSIGYKCIVERLMRIEAVRNMAVDQSQQQIGERESSRELLLLSAELLLGKRECDSAVENRSASADESSENQRKVRSNIV